jgi:hypothetical protein
VAGRVAARLGAIRPLSAPLYGLPHAQRLKQRLGQLVGSVCKRLDAAGSYRFGLAVAYLGVGFSAASSAGVRRVAKVLGTCCSFHLLQSRWMKGVWFYLGIETAVWLVPPPHICLASVVKSALQWALPSEFFKIYDGLLKASLVSQMAVGDVHSCWRVHPGLGDCLLLFRLVSAYSYKHCT